MYYDISSRMRKGEQLIYLYCKYYSWTGNNKTTLCTCPCKTKPVWHNLTQEEILQWLRRYKVETRKELVLRKKTLMSSKRRLISAPDPRPSARQIGVIGAVIICGVVGAIVSLDCPRVWKYFLRLNRKIVPEYPREPGTKVNIRKQLPWVDSNFLNYEILESSSQNRFELMAHLFWRLRE
jgi:hypothetical protein